MCIVSSSSQVLFSISQKLIQHQIVNYTDILKWLREILIRRNAFLSRHKEYANLGSQIAICKQAHIKLEVRDWRRNLAVSIFLIYIVFLGRVFHVFMEYRYGRSYGGHELLRSIVSGGGNTLRFR